MKPTRFVLPLTLLAFLSCNQQKEQNKSVNVTSVLVTSPDSTEIERVRKRKQIAGQDKIDSLFLDKILKDAITIAEQNVASDKFEEMYVETIPDSSYQVEVNINCDFYFSKKNPHFIIRRNTPGTIFIDVFAKINKRLHKVISHEQWGMTYVKDSVWDVNGDGLKDFVVNWYGSTGCCLKAFSDVYLLRSDKKAFSRNISFINPTFSPKEKIIRGICYGHPGETEMYKYKWKGEKMDTVEYVSYEKNEKGEKTGKVIISDDEPYGNRYKIRKRVNDVPDEYKKIEGYDWFTGEGY
ncbi:MAG: XAC2610-related protein [Agriterribacter sp.]